MKNGFGPTPAPVVALPMRDASEHVPASASAFEHSSTFLILPSRPFGASIVSVLNRSSPSSRDSETLNGVLLPATGFSDPARNVGENSAAGQAPIAKLLPPGTIASPQETNSAFTV